MKTHLAIITLGQTLSSSELHLSPVRVDVVVAEHDQGLPAAPNTVHYL